MHLSLPLIRSTSCVWAAVLLLTACAFPGGSGGINGGAEMLTPQERRLQAVENRLAVLHRQLENQSAGEAQNNPLRLQEELSSLRGEVERLGFELRQQESRNRLLYMDIDQRLSRLDGGSAPASAAAATPAETARTAGTAVVQAGAANPEEEGAYLASFELLKNGDYDKAITGFQAMLKQWPTGRFADSAAYWMGEAHYVKRDYKSAAAAFSRVVEQFPQSSKAADALFKLGLTQYELKQPDQGKATLQKVISSYPNSNAARLAQQRLAPAKAP
jgi:tol-pal system protein YbgF